MRLNYQNIKLNKKQSEFLQAQQPIRCFLGSRASGKTFTIGLSILHKMIAMPCSKGALASTNFYQLTTKTISSILKGWKTLGMVEGEHYVVGKEPPKHWPRAINEPKSYKNVISVYWGSCCEMISLVRIDGARGGTYDYLEVDEAALVTKEAYTTALIPAVRDNKDVFDSPFHQQISFYTSIPWKPSGYWILDFEEKAKLEPTKYYWQEANAYDNIHILGEDGIQRLREEMDFLEFQVEIMNKRISKSKNPFYPKFDADRLTYSPVYKQKAFNGLSKLTQGDIKTDKFLEMSFDFGGHINTCTVWQQDGRVERCVKEFYKKGANTLKDLVNEICIYFEFMDTHYVRVWGEPRGHDAQPGSKSWFGLVQEYFEANKWGVEIAAPRGYRTDAHETRGDLLNDMFEGLRQDLPKVLFNEFECKNTIIVMQTTDADNKGKKDKRNEKNESFPQELAPHFSDTVDYYLYYKYLTKRKRKKRRRELATL